MNYPKLVNAIAKLLDDEKPKVVQIVYEALATIDHLGNCTKVLELLQESVEQEIYRKLCDRIEAGSLPILRPEGGLEFPYLTFGLSTQNSFYTSIQEFRLSTNTVSGGEKFRGSSLARERFTPNVVKDKLNSSVIENIGVLFH